MRLARPLTVLALASIPLGCPGDDTPSVDESSSSSSSTGNDDDNTVTLTTTPTTTVDPDTSTGTETLTTTDPTTESSSTDPTDPTTESSSSTDPTDPTTESSSTDPTDPTTESSGTTDPTTGTTDPTTGSTDTGGSTSTGGDVCPENDLGMTLPGVIDVDTTLADDTFLPSCVADAGGGGLDVTVSWTAPADGTYYFTTSRDDTAYDTTLALLDTDCMGAELACDDDAGVGTTSFVTLDMTAGQTVVVVVDGYNGDAFGAAELYIDALPPAGDGGTCCVDQPGVTGCDTAVYEACVCNIDPVCCDVEWDYFCSLEAANQCNATCEIANCIEPYDACDAPADDCACIGCVDDGICGGDDDCTCNDCAGNVACDDCIDDGSCDPLFEGCGCADCADEEVCAADACTIADPVNFADNVGGAITDNMTLIRQINVAGIDAYEWDVTLTMNITHTFCADMDIVLRSPGGTPVTVSTDNGAGNDNCFAGTTFSDNATTPITDTVFVNLVAVTSATPEGAFGNFRGEDPNGTWQLEVTDDAGGDIGTVVSWSLDITAADPAPTFEMAQSFNTAPATAFTNVAPAVSLLAVAGPTSICDITVTTNVTHTFNADVDMTLTSPAGTVTTLTTDNGGSNDNVFNGTVWDDDNGPVTDVVFANNVVAGPVAPEGALSTFLGEDPTGNWTLTVADDVAGDDGILNSWSIEITPCDCE